MLTKNVLMVYETCQLCTVFLADISAKFMTSYRLPRYNLITPSHPFNLNKLSGHSHLSTERGQGRVVNKPLFPGLALAVALLLDDVIAPSCNLTSLTPFNCSLSVFSK